MQQSRPGPIYNSTLTSELIFKLHTAPKKVKFLMDPGHFCFKTAKIPGGHVFRIPYSIYLIDRSNNASLRVVDKLGSIATQIILVNRVN